MNGALGPGVFMAGAGEFALTLGGAATVSWLLVRHVFGDLRGAPRACALALLTIAALLVVELIPLTFGVLTRATVPLTAVVLLTIVAAVIRHWPVPAQTAPATTGAAPSTTGGATATTGGGRLPTFRPTMVVAGIALLATATAWLAYLELADTMHVVSVDALAFHFPGVIRFIQSGSLWQTTEYLPGQAQANYPQNGDILMLAMALPWHSLAFVRDMEAPLLAVTGLASFATARELGAPRSTAAVAVLALLAIHPVIAPALNEVLADSTFLAGFSAGVLFLLRHQRTGRRRELVLAGIGLGIAAGTKWYGLTDVPAVVAVWAVVAFRGHRSRSTLAHNAGVLAVAIACAGGIWLVRNLILTGNPVFDYPVSLFGQTIFAAPPNPLRAELGFSLAHYTGNLNVIRHFIWPVFRTDFGVTGGLIVAGAIAGAAGAGAIAGAGGAGAIAGAGGAGGAGGALRTRRRRDDRVLLLVIAALLVAIAYAATPYSAQGLAGTPTLINANTRYGVPALLLAVPVLAVVAGRARWLRWPVELVLLACLFRNLHLYVPTDAKRLAITGLVTVLVVAGLWLTYTRSRSHSNPNSHPHRHVRSPGSLGVAAAWLAALAGAAVVGSYHYQRVLARAPYSPSDATINLVVDRAPPGTRIGLTGTWTADGVVPVAPLFGERMQNTVEYLGPYDDHRLWVFTHEDRFLASLRRGRFPLLEVGLGFIPGVIPAQERWAAAAGYTVLARSSRLVLMGNPHVS